jgi:polyisoprenyl-phosphate glycosyltransferase
VQLLAGMLLVQELLGHTVTGWSSLMLSIWFVGGLQLMGTGIIGEYIGKVYHEVKRRPRYAIEADTFSYTQIEEQLNETVFQRV